jgi:hypothetical protein
MYNAISESLQCDINDGSISFEFANILNDIAYDIYVEGVDVNEGVVNILDRYVTEACESVESTKDYEDEYTMEYASYDPDVDDETYIEAVRSFEAYDEVMDSFYESAMESLNKITEAYENGAITAEEMDSLLESVNSKVDAYDAFVESGAIDTIKNKIKVWAAAKKAAVKEAKKAAEGKSFSKDVIAKSGSAAAAAIMALSLGGCDIQNLTQLNKEVDSKIAQTQEDPADYDQLIIKIDGQIANINKMAAKSMADNLKGLSNDQIKEQLDKFKGSNNPNKVVSNKLDISVNTSGGKSRASKEVSGGTTTKTIEIKGAGSPYNLPDLVGITKDVKVGVRADKIAKANEEAKKAEEEAKKAAAQKAVTDAIEEGAANASRKKELYATTKNNDKGNKIDEDPDKK